MKAKIALVVLTAMVFGGLTLAARPRVSSGSPSGSITLSGPAGIGAGGLSSDAGYRYAGGNGLIFCSQIDGNPAHDWCWKRNGNDIEIWQGLTQYGTWSYTTGRLNSVYGYSVGTAEASVTLGPSGAVTNVATLTNSGAAGNLAITGSINLTAGKPLYFSTGLTAGYIVGDATAGVAIPTSTAQAVTVNLGGPLNVQTTPVGNLGAGEDDLMTYTLPASGITVTGRGVHYAWSGAVANDVNAKTLKIYFGGTAIISPAIPISVAGFWFADARIIRTGASTQRYTVIVTVTNTATNAVSGVFTAQGTLAITETATIVLKATATATTDNDLTQTVAVTEFF